MGELEALRARAMSSKKPRLIENIPNEANIITELEEGEIVTGEMEERELKMQLKTTRSNSAPNIIFAPKQQLLAPVAQPVLSNTKTLAQKYSTKRNIIHGAKQYLYYINKQITDAVLLQQSLKEQLKFVRDKIGAFKASKRDLLDELEYLEEENDRLFRKFCPDWRLFDGNVKGVAYLEPHGWLSSNACSSEFVHAAAHNIWIPQLICVHRNVYVSPDPFGQLCWSELIEGECSTIECDGLHMKQILLITPNQLIEACLDLVPPAIHNLFLANVKRAFDKYPPLFSTSDSNDVISRVFGDLLSSHPRHISRPFCYSEELIHSNAVFSVNTLLELEGALLKKYSSSLLSEWFSYYEDIPSVRAQAFLSRLLSLNPNCPHLHLLICQHYSHLFPQHAIPDPLLINNPKLLSLKISTLNHQSSITLITRLDSLDFPKPVEYYIARCRLFLDSQEPAVLVNVQLDCKNLAIYKMFTLHVEIEGGYYPDWFLPFPFHFAIDKTKFPLLPRSEGVQSLVQELLTWPIADCSIERWLRAHL